LTYLTFFVPGQCEVQKLGAHKNNGDIVMVGFAPFTAFSKYCDQWGVIFHQNHFNPISSECLPPIAPHIGSVQIATQKFIALDIGASIYVYRDFMPNQVAAPIVAVEQGLRNQSTGLQIGHSCHRRVFLALPPASPAW
jgi:hypothetical protein